MADPQMLTELFAPLRAQLLDAAAEFSEQPLGALLQDIVNDVERASAERLEIFPVAHHSPASAVHMVRRLRSRPPKVLFIELCEDMLPLVEQLGDCTLPIALQAFASTPQGFPEGQVGPEEAPLSVIAPLTEFSAEHQAIAFARSYADTELVFVDRSVDHIFQWRPRQAEEEVAELAVDEEVDEAAAMHGAAVGVELGRVLPSFSDFAEFLLSNARVGHFSEWWQLYVEAPTIGADYATYRQVMFLVGSLIRRLGSTPERLEVDRLRERFMWTRMKTWLTEHKVDPADALYICGAAHSGSDVPEFGTAKFGTPEDPLWDIPAPSGTEWLHGFIPSAYSAIERQFGHPRGTISLAEASWEKARRALKLEPFALSKRSKKPLKALKATDEHLEGGGELLAALTRPPVLQAEDGEQLLGWCTGLVDLARKNGYLASTADSIAIYETSMLLAGMRGRRHPSAWDFSEAAITCLEKTRIPGKRSVQRLCEVMLGGDRQGHVGYSSAPPLLQDLYDRLKPLGITPSKKTNTRALMDFRKDPHLRELSDLLWRIHHLLPGSKAAAVIMGERRLGELPSQESWDIKLYAESQRDVIQLAFEGVTVEQVLELRLKRKALSGTRTVEALAAVEDAILYLGVPKLVAQIGARAVTLLPEELGADDAPEIFERARRLVHHFRSQVSGLPEWLREFVAAGYQHYATLLPQAFADRGTSPEQLSGLLSFVFTLESLALSMGCQRSQLLIAVRQARPLTTDADKQGLLWAAEWLLELRSTAEVRASFAELLDNPLRLAALPATLSGFLLALSFTPLVGQLAVELLSRAFLELPDAVLIPWMPGLINTLKPHSTDLASALLKEAAQSMPRSAAALDAWTPPWEVVEEVAVEATALEAVAAGPELSEEEAAARALLLRHREAGQAWARRLGVEGEWVEALAPAGGAAAAAGGAVTVSGPTLSVEEAAARALLLRHREAGQAWAKRLGAEGEWSVSAVAAGSSGGGPAGGAVGGVPAGGPVAELLERHPETSAAWSARVG